MWITFLLYNYQTIWAMFPRTFYLTQTFISFMLIVQNNTGGLQCYPWASHSRCTYGINLKILGDFLKWPHSKDCQKMDPLTFDLDLKVEVSGFYRYTYSIKFEMCTSPCSCVIKFTNLGVLAARLASRVTTIPRQLRGKNALFFNG